MTIITIVPTSIIDTTIMIITTMVTAVRFGVFFVVFDIYDGGSKSSRKSAGKFIIVFGNLRSLCIL